MRGKQKIGAHYAHEAAEAYPMLQGEDMKNFIAGVKDLGRCDPHDPVVLLAVTTDEELILDGRNRYYACVTLGFEPAFRYFDPATEGDPIAFVKRKNNDRRHQERLARVLCLERLVTLDKADRKQKNKQAWLAGVDGDDVGMVKQINADAEPEVVAAFHAGEIEASLAAELSKHEPDEQREGLGLIRKDREAEEKPKPVRARQVHEALAYAAGELSPTDIAALVTLCRIGEKSVHPEAGHGASVLRRMVPGLGGK